MSRRLFNVAVGFALGVLLLAAVASCGGPRAPEQPKHSVVGAVIGQTPEGGRVTAIEVDTGTLYILEGYNRCGMVHVPKGK